MSYYAYSRYKSNKLKKYNELITLYKTPVKKLTVIDFNKLASRNRYSLTHSLMLTHSFTYSPTHSPTHLLTYSRMRLVMRIWQI